MTIRVLYFAAVRELVGLAEEQIELPAQLQSLEQLAQFLCERHSQLAGRLGAVRFAKNEEFAEPQATLADGDVIALIPPVAGG
jgi:molybdopterin synthase sulfur carrier subunit